MKDFLIVLLSGTSAGTLYALLGLGFSLIYGVLGEINLAYGDAAILSAYLGYEVYVSIGQIWLAIPAALLSGGALSVAIELFVVRVIRPRGGVASPIIATLGVALIIENISQSAFSAQGRGFTSFFGTATIHAYGTSLDSSTIVGLGMLAIVGCCSIFFFAWTRWGRAARAIRLDMVGALVSGVPVRAIIMSLYFAAGLFAAFAGIVAGSQIGAIDPQDGLNYTLVAFTAAVIGGGTSINGAIAGGLLLGFVESGANYFVGGLWGSAASLIVLLAVLVIRPRGVTASRVAVRV